MAADNSRNRQRPVASLGSPDGLSGSPGAGTLWSIGTAPLTCPWFAAKKTRADFFGCPDFSANE